VSYTPQIKAIPTYYEGIKFRSRLEAKWAALFDNLFWAWTYEPYDLNGWAPDFSIKGKNGDILVEVKPVPGAVLSPEFNKATEHDVAVKMDILLLGHSPIKENGRCFIGLCNQLSEGLVAGPYYPWWGRAVIGVWDGEHTEGYCHEDAAFVDRISGKYDGGCFGRGDPRDLMELWASASNLVQWNPK